MRGDSSARPRAASGRTEGPGRPGRLLSPGSHRSRRADFPHLARHAVVPALSRFRRPGGDTLMRFDALAWFQTPIPRRGVPFPPPGPGGPVPRLRRYYGTLRLPTVRLAAFRCLHLAIPSLRPSFVPLDGGRATGGLGVVGSGLPAGMTMETIGSLRFPGNPCDHCPCSPTPVGSIALHGSRCYRDRHGPRSCPQRRLPTSEIFGAQSHGL